jgi:acyl-CoA thioester hydrolase
VRYAETDRMGVVHHANYVIYCEEARNQFSRDMGASYADFEKEGLFLVVSEVNLRYLAPAFFGQEILIQTWLEDMRSRRITFGYKIMNPETGVVHATADVKLICTNREGTVQRIPQSWVDAWTKALDTHTNP